MPLFLENTAFHSSCNGEAKECHPSKSQETWFPGSLSVLVIQLSGFNKAAWKTKWFILWFVMCFHVPVVSWVAFKQSKLKCKHLRTRLNYVSPVSLLQNFKLMLSLKLSIKLPLVALSLSYLSYLLTQWVVFFFFKSHFPNAFSEEVPKPCSESKVKIFFLLSFLLKIRALLETGRQENHIIGHYSDSAWQ